MSHDKELEFILETKESFLRQSLTDTLFLEDVEGMKPKSLTTCITTLRRQALPEGKTHGAHE